MGQPASQVPIKIPTPALIACRQSGNFDGLQVYDLTVFPAAHSFDFHELMQAENTAFAAIA